MKKGAEGGLAHETGNDNGMNSHCERMGVT